MNVVMAGLKLTHDHIAMALPTPMPTPTRGLSVILSHA
jgi:hypothetical protein